MATLLDLIGQFGVLFVFACVLVEQAGAPIPAYPVLLVAGSSWLILFGLATCRWVTARYSLDFMLLMTMASVACIEYSLTMLAQAGFRARLLSLVAIALIVYSTAVGVLLVFRGGHGPELETRLRRYVGGQAAIGP